jgi:hypothetical protein
MCCGKRKIRVLWQKNIRKAETCEKEPAILRTPILFAPAAEMHVVVLFGEHRCQVELAIETPLAPVETLLAALTEVLPGDVQDAIASAPHEVKILVAIGEDNYMHLQEVLEQLGDEDKVLAALAGVDGRATIKLVQCVPPAINAVLHVVKSDGSQFGSLELRESATYADLLGALREKYTGDVSEMAVQYPAKKEGLWLSLSPVPPPESSLLGATEKSISGLLPFLKPSVPTTINALRVCMPADAALKPATRQAASEPAEAEGEGADPSGFSASQLKALAKVIATSKSGGENPVGREWAAKLAEGLLTFSEKNAASAKVSSTGWYSCSLCPVTGQIDSAHGGTLRHVCGVGHVKKWLAAVCLPWK